jgi:hypothetical protein
VTVSVCPGPNCRTDYLGNFVTLSISSHSYKEKIPNSGVRYYCNDHTREAIKKICDIFFSQNFQSPIVPVVSVKAEIPFLLLS